MFKLDKQQQDGVLVLALKGSLDAMTAATFKPEVVAIAESKALQIVCRAFAKLTLIDSTGVGVLISLFKRARAAGRRRCFSPGLSASPKKSFACSGSTSHSTCSQRSPRRSPRITTA